MAATAPLKHVFEDYRPKDEFSPTVFYGEDEDALIFYFRNEPDYRKRLNSRVTLYLSSETDELVGCQIKGIRSIVEDLPNFIEFEHGRINLRLVFAAFLGTVEDEESRRVYRELGRAAADSELVIA